MPMDHAHAQRDGHGLLAVVMRMVTWDGEEPDRENKNQNADHAEQEAVHNYSTSFLVGLSGRVFCADSQETSAQGQWPGLSTEQIVLTSMAFPSRIVDDRFHQLDDNMSVKRCQGGFWWNRVYSGGADMNWFRRFKTGNERRDRPSSVISQLRSLPLPRPLGRPGRFASGGLNAEIYGSH